MTNLDPRLSDYDPSEHRPGLQGALAGFSLFAVVFAVISVFPATFSALGEMFEHLIIP